jgi:O-succinylbenzoic acid--CoA ligase
MISDDNTLTLNGKTLSFKRIKDEKLTDYDPRDRGIISFLQQWMDGQTKFEAQTSGSTGQPKKILLSREQMTASAILTARALQLSAGMTALLCLDPELIAGKMMMVRCMTSNMHLVVTRPVANPLDHLATGQMIDFAAMVPLQVTTIIDSGKYPTFGDIKMVIVGGGAVSEQLRSRIQSFPTSFYATFGMTETLSHVALQKLNGPDQSDTFHALPGIEFTTEDRGCLVINAPHLNTSPIITNDLVELVSPLEFHWRGRWDHVINSGGVKIMPEEIEKAMQPHLQRLGIINSYFIAGISQDALGEEAVLVMEGFLSLEMESRLLLELKESLDRYKAPRRILYSNKFSVTTMGKVKRSESLASASPRPRASAGE